MPCSGRFCHKGVIAAWATSVNEGEVVEEDAADSDNVPPVCGALLERVVVVGLAVDSVSSNAVVVAASVAVNAPAENTSSVVLVSVLLSLAFSVLLAPLDDDADDALA